tara:strand:- start:922 stop:2862 length:1941 start_codon:yes stop_codon:yes gene_type:complete
MKVPQYKAQTKLPAYGGGMLSAQASPGRMGSVGAAQAQMGATIANEAVTWGTHFRKIEIATETAGHVETFRKQREKVLSNAALQGVNTWMQGGKQQNYNDKRLSVENNLSNFMQRDILSKIKDKTIRRAVQTQLNADLISTMTQAKPLLQKRYLDFSRAESKKYLQGKALELASIPHGSELYKSKWASFQAEAQKFAALGNWNEVDVYKYTAGAEGSIQELRLNQDIINAQGNVDKLQEVYNSMRSIDPNTAAQYNKINPDRMQRITSQVQSDLDRERRAAVAEGIANENREFINANRKQETDFESIADKILARRIWDQTDPRDRTGNEPPPVSVTDVRMARVEPRQQAVLEDMVTGAADIINPTRVNALDNEIDQAVTDADLDAAVKTVKNDHLERRIGQKARQQLLKRIDDTRKKTPEALQIKEMRDLLKRATMKMQETSYGSVAVDGGPEQAAALFQFNKNLQLGQRPVEAYYNAYVDNVAKNKKEAVAFLMKNVDPAVRRALPALSKVPTLDTGKFEQDDVQTIRAQINEAREVHLRQALGLRPQALRDKELTTYKLTPQDLKNFKNEDLVLSKNERVTVRQLYATERALDMLEDAYNSFAPPPPPPLTIDTDSQAANDAGWFEKLKRQFTRDDEVPPGVPQ